MSNRSGPLFVGIGGHVFALDAATGVEIWRRKLTLQTFVSIRFDGHFVVAGAKGEVFALDPATGEARWHNRMPGLGTGFICFESATEQTAAAAAEFEAAAVAAAAAEFEAAAVAAATAAG